MKPDKPVKQRDLDPLISHLRAYARSNKLTDKPKIIVRDRAFCVKWKTKARTFKAGPNFSDEDFTKLIKALKRW
jgi:hypothetical protein